MVRFKGVAGDSGAAPGTFDQPGMGLTPQRPQGLPIIFGRLEYEIRDGEVVYMDKGARCGSW